jgi:hypothetical protein
MLATLSTRKTKINSSKSKELNYFLSQLYTGEGYVQKNYVQYIVSQKIEKTKNALTSKELNQNLMNDLLDDLSRFNRIKTEVNQLNAKIYA